MNNPNDQDSDPYPYPPTAGNYRSREQYPHVTFDPVLDSAPFDHGCAPEDRRFSRRGPPPPSPASAYDTMRRWNLRFSGARDEDPEDYILKIIEGRSVIPVADEVILRLLPFFLSGIALSWFRSNRFRWRSFGQFAAAFRSRFGDSDFQFELRQEVHRRTQGEREPVADYLTCMIALFDRLEPRMTEAEELSYAHRNLLPRLQLAIPRGGAVNLTHLKQLAVSAEKTYRVAKAYKPPPTPERSLLPSLAYREPRGRNMDRRRENIAFMDERDVSEDGDRAGPMDRFFLSQKRDTRSSRKPSMGVPTQGPGSTDPDPRRADPQRTTGPSIKPLLSTLSTSVQSEGPPGPLAFLCWNCKKEGHRHSECPEPRRIFCFRCGKLEVTRPNCPRCSGNGIGSR